MTHRDRAAGAIGGAVAAIGLLGTAIVGLQSAAAAPTAPTASRPTATVAAVADVRLVWADVDRPAAGSVRVPASVDSLPAGAVVSTELARLDGERVSGVLFDPDSMSLIVDAGAGAGRYRVTAHVLRGGVEIARATDEFAIR